ncbi:conserved hypothetical protein [Ricinus communis]|uniref:DUF4408 domain-containing protein n=2 Tax=Ricinus communis TaxID=3988 RepID=B9SW50_RICCO|nr:conserved hypothetical protein [Ricinus communis]|eukprot:XP_002530219.1 uncharacterized protein LOC8264007 [Ricinus communis]
MEAVKKQKLGRFSITSLSLQLATKFLGSVFFLSVILLSSSLLPSILNSMQLFGCKLGKNCMFLLCNGILVLIVKNSGLVVPNCHHQDINLTKNGRNQQKELELPEVKTEVAKEKVVKVVKEVQGIEDKSLVMIAQDVDIENQRPTIIQENEEEEEFELLSTEELNKKCDDFIREMRKQLILVQSY